MYLQMSNLNIESECIITPATSLWTHATALAVPSTATVTTSTSSPSPAAARSSLRWWCVLVHSFLHIQRPSVDGVSLSH